MTKLLDEVIDRVRTLPPDQQDQAAELLGEFFSSRTGESRLTDAQWEEVGRRLIDLESGRSQPLPEDDLAAFWRRMGA